MGMYQLRIDESIPARAVSALQMALGNGLVAVVLFGSQARGDPTPASDWDMLVVAEELPNKLFERHRHLKRLLPADCRGAISALAKTPQEFEAHLPSLYLDIALDGRILYDPRGYAAERLATLRRLLKQSGLYRERTEAGDVWRWTKEPSGPWALTWEMDHADQ
jgi:predicted nucleotidyltransferase